MRTSKKEIILAEVEKSPTEIVRVIRHKLGTHDLISIKVFSCSGLPCDKGISMHLPQWEIAGPAIMQGLQIEFRKVKQLPAIKSNDPKRMPALRVVSLDECRVEGANIEEAEIHLITDSDTGTSRSGDEEDRN